MAADNGSMPAGPITVERDRVYVGRKYNDESSSRSPMVWVRPDPHAAGPTIDEAYNLNRAMINRIPRPTEPMVSDWIEDKLAEPIEEAHLFSWGGGPIVEPQLAFAYALVADATDGEVLTANDAMHRVWNELVANLEDEFTIYTSSDRFEFEPGITDWLEAWAGDADA